MLRNFLSSLLMYVIAIIVGLIILCIHIRNSLYKLTIRLMEIADYVIYPVTIIILIVISVFTVLYFSYNTAEYVVEFNK